MKYIILFLITTAAHAQCVLTESERWMLGKNPDPTYVRAMCQAKEVKAERERQEQLYYQRRQMQLQEQQAQPKCKTVKSYNAKGVLVGTQEICDN